MSRLSLKIIFLILCSLPISTYAYNRGFYLGGQFGFVKTSVSGLSASDVPQDIITVVGSGPGTQFIATGGVPFTVSTANIVSTTSPSNFSTNLNDNIYGAKIYIGYRALEQLAFELGYLYVKNQTSSYTAYPVVSVNGTITNPPSGLVFPYTTDFTALSRKDAFSEKIIDINVKAIVPLRWCFEVYAKLGVAYVQVRKQTFLTLENSSNTMVNPPSPPQPPGIVAFNSYSSYKTRSVGPTLGVGLNYLVSPNMGIDASWYRVVSKNNEVKNIDFFSIGFTYQFTDLFNDIADAVGE